MRGTENLEYITVVVAVSIQNISLYFNLIPKVGGINFLMYKAKYIVGIKTNR